MAKRRIDEVVSEVVTEEPVKEVKTGTVKVLSNFRSSSNADSDILSTIEAGTKVEIVGKRPINGFYKINFNNNEGYIREDLIDLN